MFDDPENIGSKSKKLRNQIPGKDEKSEEGKRTDSQMSLPMEGKRHGR